MGHRAREDRVSGEAAWYPQHHRGPSQEVPGLNKRGSTMGGSRVLVRAVLGETGEGAKTGPGKGDSMRSEEMMQTLTSLRDAAGRF